MTSPWRIIGEFFVDFFVFMTLVVLASVSAGLAQDFFTPNLRFMYGLWFILGMLPLLFYVRWRQKLDFDFWDLLAIGAATSTYFLISQFFPAVEDIGFVLFLLAMLFYSDFRGKSFPKTKD